MPIDCVLKGMSRGCKKKDRNIICDNPEDFECDEGRFKTEKEVANIVKELNRTLLESQIYEADRFKSVFKKIVNMPLNSTVLTQSVKTERDRILAQIDSMSGGRKKTKRRKLKKRKTCRRSR